MAKEKILIYGDIHLNSKNYGGHRDYASESLKYFQDITKIVEENEITHLIGLGDFTFSRFHTLEYRSKVETELEKQYKLTNGNRFEIKGNHDVAGYGMTEYEYYVEKGLIRPSENLVFNSLNLSMIDSGMYDKADILKPDENKINIVLAHDYFKFKETQIADYGKAIELDEFSKWFGVDYLICGHIHKQEMFSGSIIRNGEAKKMIVAYPGCMSRPSYREGHMDNSGMLIQIVVGDSLSDTKIEIIKIPLLTLEESFNLTAINKKQEKKEEKRSRVDISDIVTQLDAHDGGVGNPEDIIMAMVGIEDKYKLKAIELLKSGQSQ